MTTQQSLWATDNECFDLPDAQITYWPDFFPDHRSIFKALYSHIDWQQDVIQMYGKAVEVPRLSAWYGDEGLDYSYSGLHLQAKPWIKVLGQLKLQLETTLNYRFNSVLANLYRDGHDSVAWHSDDEPELGRQPLIASLSFGATRRFSLRHKKTGQMSHIDLASGSLLVMADNTQHYWQHQIAKSKHCEEPRINLTFRKIVAR